MSISTTTINLSKYDPQWFVNRDDEFKKIRARVQQARNGAVEEPIVNYWGIQGIGKSWLLQHTWFTYQFHDAPPTPLLKPTFTLLYNFEKEGSNALLPDVVKVLSTNLLTQIPLKQLSEGEKALFDAATKNGDEKAFVRGFNHLSQRFAPILLLDDTQHVPFPQWQIIERQLLEPIVVTNRVVVVIAGRKHIPHWHRFEVRRRVTEPRETAIAPFTREQVIEQLEKRDFAASAEWIMPHTAGSPGLVIRFADKFSRWEQDKKEKETEQKWLERHRNDLLKLVADSKRELLESTPADIRSNIDVLFPLRFYRSEALRDMRIQQQISEGQQPEDLPGVYYLNLLKRLEFESDVVWWDEIRRADVTSPIVRQLIRQNLRFGPEQTKYIQAHRTALQLYWQSAEEFPRVCEDFILEIWFHLANIHLESKEPNKWDKFKAEFQETLTFIRENLNFDRRSILKRLYDRDQELESLLPSEILEHILKELKNTLQ